MMISEYTRVALEDAASHVLQYDAHEGVKFPLDYFDNRDLQQFKSRLADPHGQKADYRVDQPDKKCLHIQEYDDCYLIHWDYANPSRRPFTHLIKDAPHHIWNFLGLLLGIIAGVLVERAISKQ